MESNGDNNESKGKLMALVVGDPSRERRTPPLFIETSLRAPNSFRTNKREDIQFNRELMVSCHMKNDRVFLS